MFENVRRNFKNKKYMRNILDKCYKIFKNVIKYLKMK